MLRWSHGRSEGEPLLLGIAVPPGSVMKIPKPSPLSVRPRQHLRGPSPTQGNLPRRKSRRRSRRPSVPGWQFGAALLGRGTRLVAVGVLLTGMAATGKVLWEQRQGKLPWTGVMPSCPDSKVYSPASGSRHAVAAADSPSRSSRAQAGAAAPAMPGLDLRERRAPIPGPRPTVYVPPGRVADTALARPSASRFVSDSPLAASAAAPISKTPARAVTGPTVPTAAPQKAIAAFSGVSSPAPNAAGQTLTVDTANGNSPYAVTADDSFLSVIVGNAGTGVVNHSAGTLTISSGLTMGYSSGSSGTYNLSGTGSLSTGPVAIGLQGSATFTQSGTSTFSVAPGSLFYLGYSPGSSGTYNLNGGTLTVGTVTGNSGTSTFNFNGGTLQAARGSYTFFQGLTTANVQAGGAIFDSNGFNPTIAQNLLHDTTSGAPAVDGGLTKNGTGTLALSGANTFTGTTTVNVGTLNLLNPLALQNSTLNLSNAAGSGAVTFDSTVTSKAFTVGGLSGNGDLALVNNAATPAAVALSAGNNGTSTTYSGGLSGAGGLTKIGAGTLTLSGTNTYTGATTVNGGTLAIAGGSVGAANSSAALTVSNSSGTTTAAVLLSGGSLSTGAATIGSAGTAYFNQTGGSFTTNGSPLAVGVNNSGNYNLSAGSLSTGAVSIGSVTSVGGRANGTFMQSGGTFTTNGNTFSIGYVSPGSGGVANGTYMLSGGLLSTGAASLGVNSGVMFNQFGGTFSTNGAAFVLNGGMYSFGSTVSASVLSTGPATIGNNGEGFFVQAGGSVTTNGNALTLAAAAGSRGDYLIDSGTLTVGSVAGGGGNSVFNFNGGTLQAAANSTSFVRGLTTADIGQNATLVIDSNGFNVTIGQALTSVAGNGGLTKVGAGTLTLTGTNTYMGTTTVNAGTLAITAGSVGSNGGIFVVNGTGTNGATATLSGGSLTAQMVYIGGAAPGTPPGNTSGSGAFTQSGGTFTVTSNGFMLASAPLGGSGSYTLSGGSLSTDAVYIGGSGAGTFVQTGGTFTTNGNQFLVGAFGGNNSSTYNLSGTGSLSTGMATIGSASTGTFTQSGGTFTTNGNPLYIGVNASGSYNLSAGSLSTGAVYIGAGAPDGGPGSGSFIQSGGTFTTNGSAFFVAGTGQSNSSYTLSSGSLSTGAASIGGSEGSSTFTQSGGTFTTNGSSLVVGGYMNTTYNLDGGTLTVGSVAGGSSGPGTFNFNGGTLQAGASSTAFLSKVTADVQANGAIIDTNGNTVTVAQNLAHDPTSGAPAIDGGLTKVGAGTLILTGAANNYTGPTTVAAGTLAVNGALTGTGMLTVNGGGTLAGTGSAAGNVRIQAGGTLASGQAGAGTLTLGGDLTLTGTATATFVLSGTAGNTQADVAGQIDLGSQATLSLSLAAGTLPTVGEKLYLLDTTGKSLVLGGFSNAPLTGSIFSEDGVTYQIDYLDTDPNDPGKTALNDVSVMILAVPEPGTWTLLFVGGAGVLGLSLRRLRRRAQESILTAGSAAARAAGRGCGRS